VEHADEFVTFSLTNGPEYHLSQTTYAVIVASSVGASLVIPDIRGSQLGVKRNYEDIYDVDVFIKSMEGVVKIASLLTMLDKQIPTIAFSSFDPQRLGGVKFQSLSHNTIGGTAQSVLLSFDSLKCFDPGGLLSFNFVTNVLEDGRALND